MRIPTFLLFVLGLSLLTSTARAGEARLKDVTRVYGTGANPVMGHGLVVGLPGTGDSSSSLATSRAVANLLRRYGLPMDPASVRSRNVAAVMVTGSLPAFARSGERVDVTVSSIGDARSLSGGTLLMTHLDAADGRTFVTAQGPLVAGERSGSGLAATSRMLTGRVPGGGLVLEDFTTPLNRDGILRLVLNSPDYATAQRVAEAINGSVAPGAAVARDPSTVEVAVPEGYRGREAELLSRVETLTVAVDSPARVIVNERTGTVILGGEVRCNSVAISHGNLRLTIAGAAAPPSAGLQSGLASSNQVGGQGIAVLRGGATIEEVVEALNDLGAPPQDLIEILQALKASGALQAELEVL